MTGKRKILGKQILAILQHVEGLPPEAAAPLTHYARSSVDVEKTLDYLESKVLRSSPRSVVGRRHLGRFRRMMLIHLIECFERFLKEVAAVCVDCLGQYVLDDRFNAFKIQGSALAAHFGTDTLGRSLCESIVWLDCDEINARFRKLLADPFTDGTFVLFPKPTQQPSGERGRYELLELIWQLRHTMVHNVGVITQSDAIKLRLLVKASVTPDQMLAPTKDDCAISDNSSMR